MIDRGKLNKDTARLVALIATPVSLILLLLFRLQSNFAPVNEIHGTGRMDGQLVFSTLLAIVGFVFSFSFWPQLGKCMGMIIATGAVLYLNISVAWYVFR